MELLFLLILVVLMAYALGSGYPVAFALPGSSIIAIVLAAICGYLFAGDMDAYFAQGGPGQWLSAGVTNLRGVYWEPERDTLIAIPLFIFMGIMLQRSKIAEDLLITMAQLFGPVPGGLGISVVFVGALLAATTGIVGATVVAMGLISLPAMLRNNYSPSLATGTIAASGTLGQIIPPSIVLIILADQLASAADQAGTARKALFKDNTGELSMPSMFDVGSTSAGEMFLGAFVPGLVLVALYMIYILVFAFFNPKSAPAVRHEGKFDAAFWKKVFLILIPPLALIFLVLGSIISGIATVNQAGAIGASGALVMAGYRLKEGQSRAYWPALLSIASLILIGLVVSNFDTNIKSVDTAEDQLGIFLALTGVAGLITSLAWSAWRAFVVEDTLRGVMVETAKTTSLVFIILLGAAMLTAAFRAFGGEELVKHFLEGLPGGFWTKFVIVMAVIFILGFVLDCIEIAVVVVPIVAPILLADPSANVTAVWLGVMIGLNIQTSFLTPPFGFALFYLRGVAPAAVKTIQMYKGVISFIGLQLLALVIVGLYPSLVNYLPNRSLLLSETAPPPRNPQLQYCVEKYAGEQFAANGDRIMASIAQAKEIDLSALPPKMAKDFEKGIGEAEGSIDLLNQAFEAENAVIAATPAYRPLHTQARVLQRDMRVIDARIKELNDDISRLRGRDDADAQREVINGRIETLEAEKAAIAAQIPAEWDEANENFTGLLKEETKLRSQYRRAVDNAYGPVMELSATLRDTGAFVELGESLKGVIARIEAEEPAAMVEVIQAMERQFGSVEGPGDVKSALAKARRALRAKTPDKEKAIEEAQKGIAAFDEEVEWRSEAASQNLLQQIEGYNEAIKGTIGMRQQARIPRDLGLYIASCNSGHRDVSLSF
ncbi:MAG: TRAP transporter large permease subunit [Pseudomonadota bacterium]